MSWPSHLLAVDEKAFQAAFIEQLEYGPAKYLGIEGHGMDADEIDQVLSQVYHENGLQPLWVSPDGPGERAEAILEALKGSDSHGLNPPSYHTEKIDEYWNSSDATGLSRLDILLSLGLRSYVGDMREGRAEPRKLDPKLFETASDVKLDFKSLRKQALGTTDMKAFLDEQVPPFIQYHKLRKALKRYREIDEKGGWKAISQGEVLKAGMKDERIRLIRKRLAITGDLQSKNLDGTLYDDEVGEGVTHFQSRHGLEVDGIVGGKTLSVMNVPVDERVRQIIINMERYRWIKHQIGDRVIAVNIAGFRVLGVRPAHGVFEIVMPVIVGREYHKTPVFSDMIRYIEFNPYWNLPTSIAKNEMLPKLRKNSHYLKERNIRVFENWDPEAKELDSTALDWKSLGRRDIARFKLRQDPGPKNALGTVKFVFPNTYNVYLHDTPGHSLFQKTQRTFSHGCVRVSRPAELASYVLGGEEKGWGIERIKEIIATGKRQVVPLEEPLPIYILYRTVLVDPENDTVNFRKDVYGRDALLAKALF
jgi:murein L,D-transpeptidase YcbB/YkuD